MGIARNIWSVWLSFIRGLQQANMRQNIRCLKRFYLELLCIHGPILKLRFAILVLHFVPCQHSVDMSDTRLVCLIWGLVWHVNTLFRLSIKFWCSIGTVQYIQYWMICIGFAKCCLKLFKRSPLLCLCQKTIRNT